MPRRFFFCAFCLLLTSTYFSHAQLPPEKAVGTFTLSPGLEITLWASEPLFANPTCMDIDQRGRVWICESINYRDTLHRRPLRRPAGDRILILEDTTGSGKADRVTTFYQSPEILAPLGIAVAKDPVGPGYKVYVAQSPDILLFEDKDGDGHADGPPRKLLSGFRGIDHDHGVHGLLLGPDGKLYFSVGDQGVAGLPGPNGKRWTSNRIDCQAGTIWRCELDGSNPDLLAHNFRNEYEPCVDSFGTIFVSDNDDDGNQQTRICYVMPGGNYGYWPRGPGQSHWHEEQPGIVPKILRTYFGSPTGMCVYEGTLLPEKYRGQLLHTDAGPRHLRCYHLTPEGAGYAVEREDMVTSSDNWFRPSDVCVAPDGSLYMADWYDPGVGGHGMGDVRRGRIFRVAPRGNRPSVPSIDLERRDGLLDALASPALSVRYMAMAKLQTLPVREFLEAIGRAVNQNERPLLRARALWQLGRRLQQTVLKGGTDTKDLVPLQRAVTIEVHQRALTDVDPRFRCQALRIIHDCEGEPFVVEAVRQLLHVQEPDAAVRREALICLRDVEPTLAKPLIISLAGMSDGRDRFYLEAVGIAVGIDDSRRDIVLADFNKQFSGWDDRVAGLVWELRPRGSEPMLESQAANRSLSLEQRLKIVDILGVSKQPSAGESLLRLLQSNPPNEIADRIVQRLKENLGNNWAALRNSNSLAAAVSGLLGSGESKYLVRGLVLAGASRQESMVPAIQKLLQTESAPVRIEAVRTLGFLPGDDAVRALAGALPVQGLREDAIRALGNHTETDLARGALQKVLTEYAFDESSRRAALAALASSRPGSVWLLREAEAKHLNGELYADAGRVLRNSPFLDIRGRARAVFASNRRLDPKKLPSIANLQARHGNPKRGKTLIDASARGDLQCLKCHTIQGAGGNVGPDLSAIGKKASRESLIESILYPSKAIADQYVSWAIETKKGVVVTGLLVEETAEYVTLRDANATDHRIAKKEIESRSKSPVSIMPSDLIAVMTEEDLIDIVEYLLSLKTEKR
jgi:putative membrane-bound dehydrogenase-like protein